MAKDDFRNFHEELWQDTKNWATDEENLAILLLSGGASAVVRYSGLDDRVEDHFKGHHTFSRDFTIGSGFAGNPITHLAIAGSGYAYSLFAEEDQNRNVAKSLLEALILNDMITLGFKTIAQDHSPNGEPLAWPSGHTSSTITLATVMNEYYGPWVGLPLYALSGFVMYERMETHEHWASDIVFGAAIGYTVGKTVAGGKKPEIFGMLLLPYIDGQTGATGLLLAKRF
ncbi:MAG: phosphatase PAP2 family protein [Sedimentisphaerales bacterium]|nr:phosphatase PAP2 family protein [Sedimentisphaerales bacterium]